jgi:hypothetical protein
MPIIRNLKKDFDEGRMDKLRSLTYEERGTKAPYITKSEGSSSNEITKRIDDASRIAQMLIDKPGLKHLANEALLKQGDITQKLQSNEKYQQGTKVGNIIRRAGGTLKHVAQVAGSTLAQVPVNGTGTHFLRAFRTDTYLQDGDPVSGFAEFFGAGGVEGSQYALRGEKVPAQGVITNSKLPSRNTTASPGEIGKYHIGIESDLTTETDISLYTPDLTYTTTDTLTNVNNVNNGQSVAKPADLRRNTTPSPGSLGIDKKNIVGDVTENVSTSNYRPDTPYTETTTVANIVNATVGSPINNPSGTGEFDQTFAVQTTSLGGTFGISNKAIEGDITGLPISGTNKYTQESTYTGFDTIGNINSVQSGEVFGADGTVPLRVNANKDTIGGSSKSLERAKQDTDVYDGSLGNTSIESGKQIQDFRSTDSVNKFNGGITNTYSFNYSGTDINKETRVGLGNPGKITRNRAFYNISDPDTVDKINKLDVASGSLDGTNVNEGGNRDLIQLEFQIITPDQKYYLAFRAFLDTFDDSFNASWNSHKYLGRAENFYTYSGFERSINIGFKIAAQSEQEMRPLYRKAATLASVTAPTYGDNGRFMRGSIAKVTVGDYIYEQPGIIESVQYTWQKDYPWEIAFQGPELGDKTGPQVLPHVLDVSLSFKVIHDFLPQTGINPFITNHKPISKNKATYVPLVTT